MANIPERGAGTDGHLLFPILGSKARGIARLAERADHASDGHRVEFRWIEARSILNRSESKRGLSLAYSINPYRGCEFGCRYCYARYTHEFLAPGLGGNPAESRDDPNVEEGCGTGIQQGRPEFRVPGVVDFRDPDSFERIIFLKRNAAWLLEQELRKIDPTEEIALGTATDPYQPIERSMEITRSLLEVFARRSGYRLGIVTKSQLIERDTDLLVDIAHRNTLVVHVTITTPDTDLARKLEPRAPRPDLRFEAVRKLRQAGLRTGILCSPLLPGITDGEAALDEMARRAAEAGASFFAAEPLFLKPCSRPPYLSFVREHFPALEAEYAARFRTAEFAARPYRQVLKERVERVCRRHRLGRRSTDALLTRDAGESRMTVERSVETAQRRLFA